MCVVNFFVVEGGVALCEMLFSSSLVAVVGSGEQPDRSPRKLKLYNTVSDQVQFFDLSTAYFLGDC